MRFKHPAIPLLYAISIPFANIKCIYFLCWQMSLLKVE